MPTATTALGWTLANWGPAPSTWDPSCTAASDIYFADNDVPEAPLFFQACPTDTIDQCWPEPTNSALVDDFLSNRRNAPYWSPGVNCPSGWESVGAASRPSDGDVTSTGIFTVNAVPTAPWGDDDAIAIGFRGALGEVLDPSETAIACCPSSMSVGRNGVCYSTLPSHTISEACYADYDESDAALSVVSTSFVLGGITHTGSVVVPTVTIPRTPARTTTRTIDADETGDLVAASMAVPIYLVHQPSDRNGSNTDGSSGSSDSNSSEGDSGSSNNTNAAAGLHLQQTTGWGRMKTIAGVLVVCAGMAFAMPW
ncbi:hypothetical protein BDW62DRAFT_8670 [Aspergillus aurantiobrunneus]